MAYVWQFTIVRERQATDYKEEFQDIIEYMTVKQSRLLATMQRQQKLMSGVAEEVWEKLLQGVLVLEDMNSAEEAELFKTSEENKEPMMDSWKTKAEELRDSCNAGTCVGCDAVSGARSSKGEARGNKASSGSVARGSHFKTKAP